MFIDVFELMGLDVILGICGKDVLKVFFYLFAISFIRDYGRFLFRFIRR